MRASRLLSILMLLQMRGRLSADVLAEEFEVSVRTIYRDIDHLSAAGVPVYAERGRTGGFALLDGYRTRLTGFSSGEADALLLAGVGPAASDLGLGPDLAAAQLKLLASLPPDSAASAQKVATRFHLDPVNWYDRADTVDFLPEIASAVWREKRVQIRYDSWKALVDRTLDPLGLVLKGGNWYLVAKAVQRKASEPRTYRITSIRKLDVLDADAVRPAKFDLARYWRTWTKEFEARLMSERAVVRISPAGLRLMRDVNPGAAHAIDTVQAKAKPGGWVEAEIPVEGLDYSARQLLRLGAEIEVVSPPALRAAVAEEAQRVAQMYAGKKRVRR